MTAPIAKTPAEAESIYNDLDDDAAAAVQHLVEGGLDPIKAVNTITMRLDPNREEASAFASARKGAARFATFGADDEAAGVGAGAGAATQTALDGRMDADESVGGYLGRVWDAAVGGYREGKQERRAEVENAYMDNPRAYGAGAVAGTIGTVGLGTSLHAAKGATLGAKAARGAAVAAPLSALSALGLGDSDTLAGKAKDAAVGAAIGGSLGALAPLAPLVAAKGKDAARWLLEKGGQNADELRVLTSAGATGGSIAKPKVLEEARRVPGGIEEMAKVMRETGISKGLTTTTGVAKRAAKVFEKSDDEIGRFVDDATTQGGKVDARALSQRLRQAAADALDIGVNDKSLREAEQLRLYADRIDNLATRRGAGGAISPADAKAVARDIAQDAADAWVQHAKGNPVSGKGEAMMTARRAAEDALDPAFEKLGLDPASYRAAKRVNQVSRIAGEAAETSIGRASKSNLLGLTTATLAQASPTLAFLRAVLGPFTASGRATAAEISRDLAKRLSGAPPETLQKVGWLADIVRHTSTGAAAGGDELERAVTTYGSDPSVVQALAELQRQQAREQALASMDAR